MTTCEVGRCEAENEGVKVENVVCGEKEEGERLTGGRGKGRRKGGRQKRQKARGRERGQLSVEKDTPGDKLCYMYILKF